MERQVNTLERLRGAKWGIFEVVVLAVLLSFSVGILSAWALEKIYELVVVIGSIACVVLCLVYVSFRHMKDRNLDKSIESIICVDPEGMPISIREYRPAVEVALRLRDAFNENPALRRQWEQQPLASMWEDSESGYMLRTDIASARLLREAFEYVVIEQLCAHLTEYFNGFGGRADDLQIYGRNDIPDVLLANRFLELFSRDMSDRDGFDLNSRASRGRVVMWHGANGYFHSFELALPAGSSIRRDENGSLVISGPAFRLIIGVNFKGLRADVPPDYVKQYMGELSPSQVDSFKVNIDLRLSVRRSFVLSGRRWRYHLWVDSFVDDLEKRFSFVRHLADIDWVTLSAVLHCLELRDLSVSDPH
ncbi:hypothetical protein ABZ554_01195 [Streptomyces sp. NPDC020125]|uniref:hypothetical protein n=1 Tax=Streptomyces sp. NPDC020125 TaxID=3154593 RepID=UPI0033CEC355